MNRVSLTRLSVLFVFALLVGITVRSHAASNLQVSMATARAYVVTGTADTDDGNNLDYICVICRNDDGSLSDVDIVSFDVGTAIDYRGGCDPNFPTWTPPFSVAVFDVTGPFSGREDTPEGAAYCESFTPKPPPEPTDGEEPALAAPAPTCIDFVLIPEWAVGGTFVSDAVIHWIPSADGATQHVITAGNSARVIGVDESGVYAKIIWVCDTYWVLASTLGPNYNYPWNGAPLPIVVVE